MKKIDILMVSTSQYGVLHHFTRKIHEAFLRAGIASKLFEGVDIVRGPRKNRSDLTVAFNGVPFDDSNHLLCDIQRIPHLALLVDPPYRFFHLLESPFIILGCDDRSGCQLLNAHGFKRNLFVPHAVESDLKPAANRDRIFDVVMLASFSDPEKRRRQWKRWFPPSILKIMDLTIEWTFSDPKISFISAFSLLLIELQRSLTKTDLEQIKFNQVMEELEMYIKGKERVQLAASVKDASVHIFGSGPSSTAWEKLLGIHQKNICTHGPVSYQQALEVMQKTKILLNPSIKNKDGAHERIFAGLACGAMVITNQSQYLAETFQDGRDIVFYRPAELNSLNDVINGYLNDEPKRLHVAEAGRTVVMQHHTWDNRIADLLNLLPPMLKNIQS